MNVLMTARTTRSGYNGYKHRVRTIIDSLLQEGHTVTLIVFRPVLEFGPDRPVFSDAQDFKVMYCRLPPEYVRNEFVSNIGRSVARRYLRRVARLTQAEVVHSEGTWCGSVAAALPGLFRIVDFHGDAAAELSLKNLSPSIIKRAHTDDCAAICSSDAILCASATLEKALRARASDARQCFWVAPCGVKMSRFLHSRENRISTRRKLGMDDRIVLVYLGGTSEWQCVPETIELVAALRELNTKIFFLLLSHSNPQQFSRQLNRVGTKGRDWLHMSVPSEDVPAVLSSADCGFLLRRQHETNDVSSPTKLGEYLAAGVPVCTTPFAGDASHIIAREGCGIIIPSVTETRPELTRINSFLFDTMENRLSRFDECRSVANTVQSWERTHAVLREVYNIAACAQKSRLTDR